ncbi:hypothetical protein Tco_0911730 [Tanacetum coccineum]|uniref:Uncharacterized protein n=1 Tax=Tanacetum coccineum TaxID=301880 RepID=A0ABQ5CWJ7_9ASTR
MVIDSPYYSVYEELASPEQTATGKDMSNPLYGCDGLPKTVRVFQFTLDSRSEKLDWFLLHQDWKLLFFDVATSFDSAVHRVHAVSFDAAVLDVASTVSAACIVAAGYIVSAGICDAAGEEVCQSTDGSKVSTVRQKYSTDEQNKGTDEQSKGTDDHNEEGSATQTTQPPTSTIFSELMKHYTEAEKKYKALVTYLTFLQKNLLNVVLQRPTENQMMPYLSNVGNSSDSDLENQKFEGSTISEKRFKQNSSEDDSEKENDELRLCLTIAPNEDKEVDYEILDKKYPIIEWKTEYLGTKPQVDKAKHLEEINQNVKIPKRIDRVFGRFEDYVQADVLKIILELTAGFECKKKYPLRKKVLLQMLELKLESEEDSTMALELIRFCVQKHKNWLVHKQTACGKDFSNPFMVDNLPKIVGFSTHLASLVKSWLVQDQTVLALASPKANELTIPEQTATGKGTSNPFMAGSLPKTTKPT